MGPAEVSTSSLDLGVQTQPHEQPQQPAILVLLVHNVVSFAPFKAGFAGYWNNANARANGVKGCTVLQALHAENQMAIVYNMEDTPEQLLNYQRHLRRPGRAVNMLSMGVVLEGARVHILRRLGPAVQVQKPGSSPCGDEALVAVCCKVANYNLWRAWWDGVADCSSRCLPVSRLAAYSSVDSPREQIAMIFTTTASQVPGVLGWMCSRKSEMEACSMQTGSARVYALRVVERHNCSKDGS